MSQPDFALRLEQRLAWARDRVGVSADAPLAEVRTRFFTLLEQENFVPEEGLDCAFRTLRWNAEGVFDAHDPPEFLAQEAESLDHAIETFASEMFALPVAERRRQWNDLYRRSAHTVRQRARLESLAAGLEVDLATLDGDGRQMHLQTLAKYSMELFPLRPTARAVRRASYLQTLVQGDAKAWRHAARRLKKKHPQWAALAPEFLDRASVVGITPRLTRPAAPSKDRTASSPRGGGWWLGLAVCIFLSFVVRAAMMETKSNPRTIPSSKYELSPELQRLLNDPQRYQIPPLPSYQPPDVPERLAPGAFPGLVPSEAGADPLSRRLSNAYVEELFQRAREMQERHRWPQDPGMAESLDGQRLLDGPPGDTFRLQPLRLDPRPELAPPLLPPAVSPPSLPSPPGF